MNRFACAVLLLLSPAAFADEATDLWMDKCQKCHGEDGRGRTRVGQREKIDDLTSPVWQRNHTDSQIRQVIEEGSTKNRKMKPYKDRLTPEQIDALVVHIRDLKASN